jgi:hypothetical protein
MDNSKPIKTPMATNVHLDLDEGGNSINLKLYRFITGSLLTLPHLGPISCLVFHVCKVSSITKRVSYVGR